MRTDPPSESKRFTLIGADGEPFLSTTPGTLGGHRSGKRFGRLDCPAALRTIANGGFVADRVFFLDAETATAAGYRPCHSCMPEAFSEWKATSNT